MALIDFKCSNCDSEFFEILNNDDKGITCPKCGSQEVKRIYKGKFYGKNGGGCTGNCGGCSGCH